jgi:hypothetical protein
MAEGIEFSVAVALTASDDGRLQAEVPRQVAERLGAGPGDVLCWTGFESGTVEVWSVKKSPYASLDPGTSRLDPGTSQ